ncbi:MAG: prepilin-type N-terminal cleavage/methylation domain-containing protein [Patescibacteria group bacterium]
MRSHLSRGFTLIEILTVLVIISILVAIVYSSFEEARENARNKAVQSELKELQLALELYRAQNGAYPVPSATDIGGLGSNCQVSNTAFVATSDHTINLPNKISCRDWMGGLVPEYIDSLPSYSDSQNDQCVFWYLVSPDGSSYKLRAERCAEGASQDTGVQPGDEFARCPLSCPTGSGFFCPQPDSSDSSVYSDSDGYASYAVYSPGGGCLGNTTSSGS